MGIEAAEVPAFDDLPEEYSPEVWDTAWLNFERAYTHARIAYRLRERQGNTFWSTAKEILGSAMGGDGEANVRYDGVTYLVPVSIGQGIAEEVLGDAPSRIGAIREPSEEIHEQEIGELEDFIRRISSAVDDLGFATDSSYTMRAIDGVLVDLGEEHWDSDLARIVREEAVNKVERAILYVHNGASMLEYHLRIYQEVQLQSRRDIYAHLLEAIKALKEIAADVKADMHLDFKEFKKVIGQVMAAAAKGVNPITRGLAIADIVEMVNDDAGEAGIEDPKELLEVFKNSTGKIRDSFDTVLESAKTEMDEYLSILSDLSLSDLTLPEVGSIFQ